MSRVALANVGVVLSVLLFPLSAPAAQAQGPWTFVRLQDSMTDVVQERAFVASKGSEITLACLPANPEKGIMVTFKPSQHVDELLYGFNRYGGRNYTILVRLDNGAPMESTWNLGSPIGPNRLRFYNILRPNSTDSTTYSVDSSGLLDLVSSSKRIRMRSKAEQNFDFDVTGASSTIKKLKRICNISAQ